jgi:hypothetical protein
MESLTCAIGSFLLGIVGWFAVGFFGKPLLDFLNLRSEVHEEIIFTGNIGPGPGYDKSACDKAQESLRRLGAKVHATNGVTTWLPLPWHAVCCRRTRKGVQFELTNRVDKLRER